MEQVVGAERIAELCPSNGRSQQVFAAGILDVDWYSQQQWNRLCERVSKSQRIGTSLDR